MKQVYKSMNVESLNGFLFTLWSHDRHGYRYNGQLEAERVWQIAKPRFCLYMQFA